MGTFRYLLLGLLVCPALASPVQANSLRTLFIHDEGGQALAGQAWVNDEVHSFREGGLKLDFAENDHLAVRVRVEGFYPTIHTLSRREWQDRDPPAVTLVARRENRKLFVLAGDAMAGRRYLSPLPGDTPLIEEGQEYGDMSHLLTLMAPYFAPADVASVNLETQLLRGQLPPALEKSVVFHTDPAIVDVLYDAGVDYVALGNNHVFDYGQIGLQQTLSVLSRSGIAYSGAGEDEQEARRPALRSGWALLSYVGWPGSPAADQVARPGKGGAAWGRTSVLQADISAQERPTLVQYHGGLEYSETPTMIEQTRLRAAVDAGADLVVAHHPHVIQGLEWYNDRLIAYSLGNFLFDQYIYSTQLTKLLYVWLDGETLHRAEVVPIYINGYQPTPATGSIRFDILQRMVQLSDGLRFELSGGHLVARPGANSSRAAANVEGLLPVAYPQQLAGRIEPSQHHLLIGGTTRPVRFGVDLVKRGSFEYWGAFETQPRNWLVPEGVKHIAGENPHLLVKGSAVTGLRTFERQFTRSSPATVSATVQSTCTATVEFWLQRRDLEQAWRDALADGQRILLGRHKITESGRHNIFDNFNLPRTNTKGVRLLVDVEQDAHCELQLDDVLMVEWRTSWLSTDEALVLGTPSTHVQVRKP